jgi:hypothetical protein
LVQLLPAPLSYNEGDTFWSFIRKGGERGIRNNFPVLVRSMTAAAIPFARSKSPDRLLHAAGLPRHSPQDPEGEKETPFDFVLLRPSLRISTRALKAVARNQFVMTMPTRRPWPSESQTG